MKPAAEYDCCVCMYDIGCPVSGSAMTPHVFVKLASVTPKLF